MLIIVLVYMNVVAVNPLLNEYNLTEGLWPQRINDNYATAQAQSVMIVQYVQIKRKKNFN